MGGKPCIRGMRMTVYDVLDYLGSGMSEDEILADFPDLTREDIRACLAFAADRERRLALVPGVNLPFDQNLSFRLPRLLADCLPGCAHVRDLGLTEASDAEVRRFAAERDLAIVTKDGDFRQVSFLLGHPPKIVWIRLGNCSTAEIERLMRRRLAEIGEFIKDPTLAVLALS